ncbi:MAG: efflux transporter outer membrane subunit [Bacteroidaceae bacterium]|nr:efflux transporter outer membrane subunit [Bacteroidaceae bacterium]
MTRIRFVFLLLWVSWGVNAQQTEKIQFASLPENWLENDALFQQVLPVDDQWWMVFEDATLDSLISLAVERNPSVLMAINRMDMAKANLGIARSAFYPTIDLNAGWTRQQSSGNMGTGNPQGWNSNFQTSLDMSWQVDVFGNIRMKAKAQKENYAATREEYNAAMVSLCAQVAQTYFNLREMQQELDVLKRNAMSQEAVVKITEVRYNTGLVAKLDVAQAKSVYYSTLASIPSTESSIAQYMNTLAVLLGLYPQEVVETLSAPLPLPDYIEPVGVGMPAQLLLRRPDVRAAERQVNAQASLLGAAKTDWFPSFFLNGSLGYSSQDLRDFTRKKSMTWSIAPSVKWTIFNGGERVNNIRLQRAQLDETINQFNNTVLTAVQEVENAMNAYKNSIKQIVACREMVNQGKEAFDLSLDLYKQGLSPFQNVLDAQRSLLTYENSLVKAKGYSLICLVQMYQALGGGWSR